MTECERWEKWLKTKKQLTWPHQPGVAGHGVILVTVLFTRWRSQGKTVLDTEKEKEKKKKVQMVTRASSLKCDMYIYFISFIIILNSSQQRLDSITFSDTWCSRFFLPHCSKSKLNSPQESYSIVDRFCMYERSVVMAQDQSHIKKTGGT